MTFIAGLHDPGGEWTFQDKPGWILHTEALEHVERGDFSRFVAMGFRNIVRLNNGYGSAGTIPTSDRYEQFAQECAHYVAQSPGVDWVMIGNEPNHQQEWPSGQVIEPTQYAKCFDLCYSAIRNTGVPVKIMTAAVAPWNQQAGDWLWYYRTMLSSIQKCDGFSLHAYTHGTNADLIYSDHKVEGWYWHFKTYLDQLKAIQDAGWSNLNLPAFITEADQDETWRDHNGGWIQNAMAEVNAHNMKGGVRQIHACIMYRWQDVAGDKWGMEHKSGVIEDFKAAVQLGYGIEPALPPTTPPPDPGTTPPITPPQPPVDERIDWDERLNVRGCTLQPALMPTEILPRVKIGRWFNKEEAGGRVNIFIRLLDENGQLAIGVPMTFFWDGGSETKPTERKSDPWLESKGLGAEYSLDFNMQSVAPAYGVKVTGGYQGDVIDGCGLGDIENPHHTVHTSYFFEFRLTQKPEVIVPEPPQPPEGELPPLPSPPTGDTLTYGVVTAPAGLNLRGGPDTSFHAYGTLRFGSSVITDYEHEGWLHVIQGWVSGEWVGSEMAFPAMPPPITPLTPGGLVHPLPGSVKTQHFYQNPKYYAKYNMPGHNGTDLAAMPAGTPILSMTDGVVARADWDEGYGNYLLIAHDQKGCYSMYCHCAELLAVIGATVWAGEEIALLGTTGDSTGVHLHLEIRMMNLDGTYREDTPMPRGRVDPQTFFALYGGNL